MTHTYAELGVSQPVYDEIKAALRKADYGHAFMEDGAIDMHGIGLVLDPGIEPRQEVTVDVRPVPVGYSAKAEAIADASMYRLLRDHCWREREDRWMLTSWSSSTLGVKTFAEAKPQIHEAFEWLQPRGYVELGTDDAGEFIRVIRRPGE